uniref:acyltransferase n=1 Tax=Lactococcus sp. TaxID=44273 RepID=UPI0034DCC624
MRKEKTFKKFYFWSIKFWIPILVIVFVPILVSCLSSSGLTFKEVNGVANTNYYTRAIYQLVPNRKFSTYIIIWFLTLVITLTSIRKMKSSDTFNGNNSIYFSDCYCYLWIAANILGYKKFQLISVSLPLQFELVINEVFSEFIVETSLTPYEKFDGDISIKYKNREYTADIMNVLICDSYNIRENDIAADFNSYPVLKISSSKMDDGIRYDNPKLVRRVREEMNKVSKQYRELNIFLTTNPKNTLKIIGSSFMASDRFGFEKISVISMDNDRIYKKAKVIYQNNKN